MRRLAPILVLAAALALGACGGSDKKNNASTTTGTTTQSTTGTTGATGSGGGRKKNKKGTGKNSTGGSKGNGGSSGGGNKGSGGSTTPTTTTGTQTKPPSQGTTPTPANVSPAKTAKAVCSQFLPEAIKRDIKRGKLTKKKVATQYSMGYPKDQRSEAYKGCLAGLNKVA